MSDTNDEHRRTKRVPVRFRAEYDGEQASGVGMVRNISPGGALIEQASTLLLVGAEINVRFSFFKDSLPVEIPAEVVRETATGFAIRFIHITPRTKSMITMAVARAAREDPNDGEEANRLFSADKPGSSS